LPYSSILAARFYTPYSGRNPAPLDLIHVRDLVLNCRIGIYDEEQGVDQRVRFTVEVSVYPSPSPKMDQIKDVICYGSIVEGIQKIIDEGHINLVETLAERIAEFCLNDRRAAKVRVLVEKLDRVPGAALGVEIERRQRAAEDANVYNLYKDGFAG
jgi:7,8-dihydroneopterin aldolase/epimerase/oxygenase